MGNRAGGGIPALVLLALCFQAGGGTAICAAPPAPLPEVPRSEWMESRKKLHRDLLTAGEYDILVVPFLAEGHTVDRVGRSLMGRYLHHWIGSTTDLRLPDYTLVARALGERTRVVDMKEIYEIADEIGVKYLVTGKAGHNFDQKLTVAIEVWERRAEWSIAAGTLTSIEREMPFVDEFPPSEMFRISRDGLVKDLPFETRPPPPLRHYDRLGELAVPDSADGLAEGKGVSPIADAWRLQALGLLFPRRISGDSLFERSLVALSDVAPSSPDLALLRARAFLYLHRRPAAVAALDPPQGADEEAVVALIEADLPGLEEKIPEVTTDLGRFMAQIELNDIAWNFDRTLCRMEFAEEFAEGKESWQTVLTQRLLIFDRWSVFSNLAVKKEMDRVFPVPGFTAESLMAGQFALGEGPLTGADVELSAHRHWKRFMKQGGEELFAADSSASPVPRDYLDLLEAYGEHNLIKRVSLSVKTRRIPEEGLAILDLLETVYSGHPAMSYYRAFALNAATEAKDRDARNNLRTQAKAHARNAFVWEGGQSFLADDTYELMGKLKMERTGFTAYHSDFPRRWYWTFATPKDRNSLRKDTFSGRNAASIAIDVSPSDADRQLALLYTHTAFSPFKNYFTGVRWKGGRDDKFLAENARRFAGNADRTLLLADRMLRRNVISAAMAIYREAISATPKSWDPYKKLGKMQLEQGKLKEAFETFYRYPAFVDVGCASTVSLSHYAYRAGLDFWRLGEISKARPLFKLSAGFETGSSGEMWANTHLLILDRRYQKAAVQLQTMVQRYKDVYGLGRYLGLLHALGYGELAWSTFDSVTGRMSDHALWIAARVGHGIDGSAAEEVAEWFDQDHIKAAGGKRIGSRMALVMLMDRIPTPETVEAIGGSGSEDLLTGLVSGYAHLMRGDPDAAFKALSFPGRAGKETFDIRDVAVPYRVYAAIKTGRLEAVKGDVWKPPGKGVAFTYHLSRAFIEGLERGNHGFALSALKKARVGQPRLGRRVLLPWYQLAETAEILYEETGDVRYGEMVLDIARMRRQMVPTQAWAWAMEANHTPNAGDRKEALAMALYLDRNSRRLSGFTETEKAEAEEWLEKNNPFEAPDKEPGDKGI